MFYETICEIFHIFTDFSHLFKSEMVCRFLFLQNKLSENEKKKNWLVKIEIKE